MPKLLIVDDDASILDNLKKLMREEGWDVETASNGSDGLQLLTNFKFDFVFLDWEMPDMTGIEVCKRFRTRDSKTPVIFVTGKGTVPDKLAGLDAGGDDYLVKPFDVRELLARMRTIRRRDSGSQSDVFKTDGIEFDTKSRRVKMADESVQLSKTESSILECLFRNPNEIFSSSKLFEYVWRPEDEASEDTVRVHVGVLRRKLALIGCADLVKTIRGSGYILELSK